MPAYVINDMEVTNPELLEEYKKLSVPTVKQFGGRFIARGGRVVALEGDWTPQRVVILEFPTLEQAVAWAESAEYAPAKLLRQRASKSKLIVIEGVSLA